MVKLTAVALVAMVSFFGSTQAYTCRRQFTYHGAPTGVYGAEVAIENVSACIISVALDEYGGKNCSPAGSQFCPDWAGYVILTVKEQCPAFCGAKKSAGAVTIY